jgi:transketolase
MNISQAIGTASTASERDMANAIRFLAMDAVQAANSGHPGMPMGMADVATVLFNRFIKSIRRMPDWPDRDRFVLSAGHGSMLLYAIHYLLGYSGHDDRADQEFPPARQSRPPVIPEYGHALGIETTTGPLGQGLATAVGMAIAERKMAAVRAKLVDHYTYVLAGDGCLQEGISHEAIDLAGHLKLSKLIVLWDDNHISIDGKATSLSTSMNQPARSRRPAGMFSASTAMIPTPSPKPSSARANLRRPTLIACRTTIGKGAPTWPGRHKTHGAPLGAEEIAGAREYRSAGT